MNTEPGLEQQVTKIKYRIWLKPDMKKFHDVVVGSSCLSGYDIDRNGVLHIYNKGGSAKAYNTDVWAYIETVD